MYGYAAPVCWAHLHTVAPMPDGLQLADAEEGGVFRLAQYGPLHSLSTRINEIWLAVKL